MNKEQLQMFVRVKSQGNGPESGVIVSNVRIGVDGEIKTLLNKPIEVSTGKTRASTSSNNFAEVRIPYGSPEKNSVVTEGTGRVESPNYALIPKLQVGSKKNRRCSRNGLYSVIQIKAQADEMIENSPIEYFDLVVGKKDALRELMPHFGFRPNGSSHFYVKTNELGATHKSYGKIEIGNGQIVPQKICIFLEKECATIVIEFAHDAKRNTVTAYSIQIL